MLAHSQAQSLILRSLRDSGPRSRVELGEATGLSRAKVTEEVRDLLQRRLVRHAGRQSRGGRPSTVLELDPDLRFVGIDIGATSIDVGLMDSRLRVLTSVSEQADVRDGPEIVLRRAVELVAKVRADDPFVPCAVGVGVPGPVRFEAGAAVTPPIMPGWNQFPVREWLSLRLSCPITLDNDVNIMALGEMHAGVAAGADVFLFVKLGTGIGCGIVINRELFRGPTGSAGDIGHVSTDPTGPLCSCGRRGCLEAYAGGRALAAAAAAVVRDGRSPILAELERSRGSLTAREIGEAAGLGDEAAIDLVRMAARQVGLVTASLVNILNPSLIVIGGGVAGFGHPLLAELRSVVYRASTPLATGNLPIVLSELGSTVGVIGAGVLASDHVFGSAPNAAFGAWT